MLYVRHGFKSYPNSSKRKWGFDPPLRHNSIESTLQRFIHYVDLYGPPNTIITSPYLRCRQTAKLAQQAILEATGVTVDIICDSTIGEYLGNQTHTYSPALLRPETLEFDPIPPETFDQFHKRVLSHEPVPNSWYITHGLVVSILYEKHSHIRTKPKELQGFYLQNNISTLTT